MTIWQSTRITELSSRIDATMTNVTLNPPLQTRRLRLEPQVRAHAHVMLRVLSHWEIYTFIPGDPPDDPVALEQRFERLESRRSPDGLEYWLNWIVFADEKAIGRVEASVRSDEAGENWADVAYMFDPNVWGQGFATEAMSAMLEHLQRDLWVKKVSANVDTRNAASIRLLERLGFSQVDLIKHADQFKGSISDEYVFEKVASAS
jgi:[ribosomal protein S5]-alanine N-acetyltransferase